IELVFSFNNNKTKQSKTMVLAITDQHQRLDLKSSEQLLFIPAQSSPLQGTIDKQLFEQWKQEELEQQRAQTEEELDQYLERE
ncbi:hypothetical protein ACJBRF_10685, partial [Streptococcus suis]